MGAKTFTTIALPDELIKEIDIIIQNKIHAYRSRPEFIKDAIRQLLRDLEREKKK